MVEDPILVAGIRKPADPSANKPTYLVRVEDPEVTNKVQYYRTSKLNRFPEYISLTGYILSKAQAKKFRENPNAQEVAEREINIEIPWRRVISIENATFKRKAQGEKNV
jgi:hypothetical protein